MLRRASKKKCFTPKYVLCDSLSASLKLIQSAGKLAGNAHMMAGARRDKRNCACKGELLKASGTAELAKKEGNHSRRRKLGIRCCAADAAARAWDP